MKSSRGPIFFSVLFAMAATTVRAQDSDDMKQRHHFKHAISRTVELGYLLHLPKDYQPKSANRWPLMLFLHGAGERGTNLSAVTRHGPPKLVKAGRELPFIIVAPQCPAGQLWDGEALLTLLDDVIVRHRVDTNRVYLTGLSMGGYGTWSLGLAHPERFAAIAPICGGGQPIEVLLADRKRTTALRALPVWAFHGAKDPVVPVVESQRMVDALRKAGAKEVELTVYPEAQHDSWTETYDNPKFYEWFLSHRRE